ncbi:glycosyltransferase family 4 protein [Clostridium beijerinckii]|uniref:Group 1 glycosyl transferase n=1 Tax=Clostridium beijerinckii TaxID=1520 RepID=A0A1S9NAA6_CLOBE|nr:glycosyltransferase family 4 protein [Clostridium beijerinckii]OOP74331.1 group 1 glycosyl transferase [Clostridium beijerinckii]
MRILITTDVFTPTVNGVVTSVLNLRTQLMRRGHDVRILTLSEDNISRKEENVYYIKSFGVNIYPDARATINFHNEYIEEIIDWEPEVIHSQCEFSSFIFAKVISKKLNIPIIHTYHTMYEYYTHYFIKNKSLGKKVVSFLSRKLLNNVTTVIAPTQKVEEILKSYGVENNIVTIPTGINLEKFENEPIKHEIDELKEELGINKEKKVLVTIGRLAREKNVEELLENMKNLLIKDNNLVLLIVGDGPFRKELEKKAKEISIDENVIFTGMINPKDIHKYYKLGDIFVSASQSETQGLTYLEALASGLPAVCKEDLCLRKVIINSYNGFLYKNSNEYLEAIEIILNDNNLYKRMSHNARKVVEEYSEKSFGRQVESIYLNQLLENGAFLTQQGRYSSTFSN